MASSFNEDHRRAGYDWIDRMFDRQWWKPAWPPRAPSTLRSRERGQRWFDGLLKVSLNPSVADAEGQRIRELEAENARLRRSLDDAHSALLEVVSRAQDLEIVAKDASGEIKRAEA